MDSIFYKCAICYKSLYIIFAISSCDHLVEVAQLGARHYLQRFRVVVLDYLVAEVVFSLLPAGLAALLLVELPESLPLAGPSEPPVRHD